VLGSHQRLGSVVGPNSFEVNDYGHGRGEHTL
jgi:hypothetical protein